MKKIFFAILLLLASNAFASELVQISGDMVFSRCENHSDNTTSCTVPYTSGKLIQIPLSVSQDSTVPSGEYKFKSESDGYRFEGSIDITKVGSGEQSSYLLQASVASIKGNDMNTLKINYLGSATVNDVAKLNEISFNGQEVAIGSNLTISPTIFVGAKSANFSVLSKVEQKVRR